MILNLVKSNVDKQKCYTADHKLSEKSYYNHPVLTSGELQSVKLHE